MAKKLGFSHFTLMVCIWLCNIGVFESQLVTRKDIVYLPIQKSNPPDFIFSSQLGLSFEFKNSKNEARSYVYKEMKEIKIQSAKNGNQITLNISESGPMKLKINAKVLYNNESETFYWSNVTMIYNFPENIKEIPHQNTKTGNGLKSSMKVGKKFLTPIKSQYECNASLPLLFIENNILLYFKNTKMQFFQATNEAIDVEQCPRDFKTDLPIAALMGSALLIVLTVGLTTVWVINYLQQRQIKKSK